MESVAKTGLAAGRDRWHGLKLLGLALALVLFGRVARADTVNLGALSFDIVNPGTPGSAGTNQFDVFNLTGIGSPYDVADTLTFLSATLDVIGTDADGNLISDHYDLLDIDGATTASSSWYLDNVTLSEADFQATLSQTSFLLSDGNTLQADSNVLVAKLLPSPGSALLAGTDATPIEVSGTESNLAPVPEPSSVTLMALMSPYLLRLASRRARQGKRTP